MKHYLPVNRTRRFFEISDATGIAIDKTILDEMFHSGDAFHSLYPNSKYDGSTTRIEIGNVKTEVKVGWDKDLHKFYFNLKPHEDSFYSNTKVLFDFSGKGRIGTKLQKREYAVLNRIFAKAICEHYENMEKKNLSISQKIFEQKDKATECLEVVDSMAKDFGNKIYGESNQKIFDDFRNSVLHDSMDFGSLEKICGGYEWNRVSFYYDGGAQGIINENFNGLTIKLPAIKRVDRQNLEKIKEIMRLINDVNG
jgi:hypothetical protein